MANAVAILSSNVPAHIKARQKQSKVDYSAIVGGQKTNRISLQGSRFHLKVAGEIVATHNKDYLDVAIVSQMPNVGRQYFGKAYDSEGDNSGPVCFSQNGQAPDEASSQKQAKLCKTCPRNAKGSGPDGKSKACGSVMRTLVLPINAVEGEGEQHPFILDAKGMSVFGKANPDGGQFNMQTYLKVLQDQNVETNEVYTRIAFDKKASVAKLVFSVLDYIREPETVEYLKEQAQTEENKNMLRLGGTAPTVVEEEVEEDEVAAPAPALVRPVKPKLAAAPVVEEEAPAPRLKLGRPKVAAPVEEAEVVEAPIAPKPKVGRPKLAAPVAQESEEAEVEAEAPKLRRPAVQARPAPAAVSMDEIDDGLNDLVGDWKGAQT